MTWTDLRPSMFQRYARPLLIRHYTPFTVPASGSFFTGLDTWVPSDPFAPPPEPPDFAGIETWLRLREPLNQPHFCTHEGPWTLHSCETCDIREAKIVVALIAWFTGQQDVLDKLKPAPMVHCMHTHATAYAPCPTCRVLIGYGLEPVYPTTAARERDRAKRLNFATTPYGFPYGSIYGGIR